MAASVWLVELGSRPRRIWCHYAGAREACYYGRQQRSPAKWFESAQFARIPLAVVVTSSYRHHDRTESMHVAAVYARLQAAAQVADSKKCPFGLEIASNGTEQAPRRIGEDFGQAIFFASVSRRVPVRYRLLQRATCTVKQTTGPRPRTRLKMAKRSVNHIPDGRVALRRGMKGDFEVISRWSFALAVPAASAGGMV